VFSERTAIKVGQYSIEWDGEHNWTLHEFRSPKSDKTDKSVVKSLIGYYSSMVESLQSLLRHSAGNLGDVDSRNCQAIIDTFNAMKAQIYDDFTEFSNVFQSKWEIDLKKRLATMETAEAERTAKAIAKAATATPTTRRRAPARRTTTGRSK
jgi:hypothetical protein